MDDDLKTCPYCAETIKAAAIKCKHCKSDLIAGPQALAGVTGLGQSNVPINLPNREELNCPKCQNCNRVLPAGSYYCDTCGSFLSVNSSIKSLSLLADHPEIEGDYLKFARYKKPYSLPLMSILEVSVKKEKSNSFGWLVGFLFLIIIFARAYTPFYLLMIAYVLILFGIISYFLGSYPLTVTHYHGQLKFQYLYNKKKEAFAVADNLRKNCPCLKEQK